ncbi:testis-specific serine/threonine-protein kinase 2-like [Sipha flava]|jgi:serine kinase|uniref:Testis-specific serine/threonine-protein kinase 2-like n=1 Tax=Sipha flava TaxID=143950 RepID=A0A8B8G2L8_9HEMI|nr:testis-specific serine/threonine-protein kinase 2-like [Sipha flava]
MFLFHNKIHESKTKLSKTNALKPEGYIILDHISQGSFGEVRHAKFLSEEDDLNLVVKIIDTNETSKEYVSKFLPRELDVMQKTNHPYIVQIHSILKKKAILYIFMANAEKGKIIFYSFFKKSLIYLYC